MLNDYSELETTTKEEENLVKDIVAELKDAIAYIGILEGK